METKSEIRKTILRARETLTASEIESKSKTIAQKVILTPEYEEADNILLYADYCHEVMTRQIFEDALMRKKRVYFPKSDGLTGNMDFYQTVSVKQLTKGYKGILEPVEDPDRLYKFNKHEDTLIIVPGVAFDTFGYRIGYGKGFYDKFLAKRRQISTIALAFACQIVDEIPKDIHDIKMDKIITEEIIYSFLRV
ncbi:MAG: 5-formyltetrahydrofolate cyclo-ligase [Lachnospiraceae bacterium]|nr:5-formyltetrahydrofolate cyclo-ligase [Lachnospiraceae bacterium]MBQ5850403.1 5-formyltetrahydrofolate cyclo-ligase [Lachnospiraceae bacterium]